MTVLWYVQHVNIGTYNIEVHKHFCNKDTPCLMTFKRISATERLLSYSTSGAFCTDRAKHITNVAINFSLLYKIVPGTQ